MGTGWEDLELSGLDGIETRFTAVAAFVR